jgi:hypothetical protein
MQSVFFWVLLPSLSFSIQFLFCDLFPVLYLTTYFSSLFCQQKAMAAQQPKFDLVQAAEALLENAKKLASSAGGGSGGGGGGGGGGGADEEDELRRRIAMTAKKIQMGTAPAIDLLKSDWVVVSPSSPPHN